MTYFYEDNSMIFINDFFKLYYTVILVKLEKLCRLLFDVVIDSDVLAI